MMADADQLRSGEAGGGASQAPHRFSGRRTGIRRIDLYDPPTSRFPYPEERFITVGLLSGRMVIVVWTPTEDGRRIISMRKANAREETRYSHRLG
jgi:hypothetical protein